MASYPPATPKLSTKAENRKTSKTTQNANDIRKSKRTVPIFPPESIMEVERIDPWTFYEKQSPLGIGSFGTVYEATKPETEIMYAIKSVKSDERHTEADLKREIGFLKHCQSDWVCGLYGAYYFDEKLILVLEYFECGSVHDLMKMAKVNLQEDFIVAVTAQVLLGLDFLQKRRVLHRDIKAGNILLTRAGQSKLCDFGVSKLFPKNENRTKSIIGTPFWMAPEIMDLNGYSYNADVWSLGVTMIEMNDGHPPHRRIEPMRALFHIQRRPPPRFTKRKKVSDELADFLKKFLVKDKEERPDAKELLDHSFIREVASTLDKTSPKGCSVVVKKLVEKHIHKVINFRQNTAFFDDDNIAPGTKEKSKKTEQVVISKDSRIIKKQQSVKGDIEPKDSLVVLDSKLLREDDDDDEDKTLDDGFNSFVEVNGAGLHDPSDFDSNSLIQLTIDDDKSLKLDVEEDKELEAIEVPEDCEDYKPSPFTSKGEQLSMPNMEPLAPNSKDESAQQLARNVRQPSKLQQSSRFSETFASAELKRLDTRKSRIKSRTTRGGTVITTDTGVLPINSAAIRELHRQLQYEDRNFLLDVKVYIEKYKEKKKELKKYTEENA